MAFSPLRSIQVVVCINSWFLLLMSFFTEYYFVIWLDHSYHSPTERLLSCFQFGAITNKAAMLIYGKVLCKHKFSFLWGKMPKSAINCWILGMFSIIKAVDLFFKCGCSVLHLHQQCTTDSLSASLPTIGIIHYFYFSHFDKHVIVILYCNF